MKVKIEITGDSTLIQLIDEEKDDEIVIEGTVDRITDYSHGLPGIDEKMHEMGLVDADDDEVFSELESAIAGVMRLIKWM